MRSDEKFKLFWKDVKNKAAILNVYPLRLLRKKRVPPSVAPEFDDNVVSYYRKMYYESLDCIINAIEDQFDQEDFQNVHQIRKSPSQTCKRKHYMTVVLTEFSFMCSWKCYQSTVKKLLTLDLFVL